MSSDRIRKLASYVERAAWVQVFFGLLTQVSADLAFPSYNAILGFWGVYAALNRHGRATFGYVSFGILSVFLDIVYCSIYGGVGRSASFRFALAMFIFCLFAKLLSLYYASYMFAAMGGAQSLGLPTASASRRRRPGAGGTGYDLEGQGGSAYDPQEQQQLGEEGEEEEEETGTDSVYDSFVRSVAPGPRRAPGSKASSLPMQQQQQPGLPHPPPSRGRGGAAVGPYASGASSIMMPMPPRPLSGSSSSMRYSEEQLMSQARGDLPEYVDDRF